MYCLQAIDAQNYVMKTVVKLFHIINEKRSKNHVQLFNRHLLIWFGRSELGYLQSGSQQSNVPVAPLVSPLLNSFIPQSYKL